MLAGKEIKRLQRKLNCGELSPDEPLFVLRGRDILAADVIANWVELAKQVDVPVERVAEAEELLNAVRRWSVKQVPGRAETRRETNADLVIQEPAEGVLIPRAMQLAAAQIVTVAVSHGLHSVEASLQGAGVHCTIHWRAGRHHKEANQVTVSMTQRVMATVSVENRSGQ